MGPPGSLGHRGQWRVQPAGLDRAGRWGQANELQQRIKRAAYGPDFSDPGRHQRQLLFREHALKAAYQVFVFLDAPVNTAKTVSFAVLPTAELAALLKRC